MSEKLKDHKKTWTKKRILREIYFDWYKMINNSLKTEGTTLELGAGTGNFKEFKADVISTDIDNQPWLDMCFDAHKMPFQDGEISNIVMIDVLHHLANPVEFLFEADRVLKQGGRVVMLEPYPSLFSRIVYKLFHPEPFIYNIDYFTKKSERKEPWESNQAIPYLLFFKHLDKTEDKFGNKFKILKRQRLSFLLFPLSGGFEHKQLIPNFLIKPFKILEKLLTPLSPLLAFRCYLVLEKK